MRRGGISWLQKVFYHSSLDGIIDMEPNGMETALLSESALAKDWLSTEEDEAWKNL
jgi:hypothetical protein